MFLLFGHCCLYFKYKQQYYVHSLSNVFSVENNAHLKNESVKLVNKNYHDLLDTTNGWPEGQQSFIVYRLWDNFAVIIILGENLPTQEHDFTWYLTVTNIFRRYYLHMTKGSIGWTNKFHFIKQYSKCEIQIQPYLLTKVDPVICCSYVLIIINIKINKVIEKEIKHVWFVMIQKIFLKKLILTALDNVLK